MPTVRMRWLAATLALFTFTTAAGSAGGTERADVPDRLKWDLTDLFASDEAWTRSRDALRGRLGEFEPFRGHLGDSPDALFRALGAMMDFSRDLQRVITYASQKSDEDTRVARTQEMRASAEQIGVDFSAAISWVRPELIALGADKVNGFVAADARLAPFRQYLADVVRYAPHTLTPGEERISAMAGRLAPAGATIRGIFNNAELPWPTVTLSTGEKVRLDDAAYTQHRASSVRADRKAVFDAFWTAHKQFENTYGAMLNAGIQGHVFDKDVHHFGSSLEAALFANNIPTSVYRQLLADVHANLPTLHRYLKLRQRMMGLDQIRYEDLYAPIVSEVDLRYTPEQAMELTLAAVQPLGKAYVDTLRTGMTSGWIDWLPSTGKRSGAYSTGAYGVHPYQLQNFTGLYDEVGTLAHESGHSMHTYLANLTQPYATSDYATFVAEVASTLNENLLFHYMLDRTKDKPTRLYLLGSFLDNLRGTLFRQTMFAEYELAIHEAVEKGEQLSGENLTKRYLDLVRTYYGHDQGVCPVDELYGVEWSYIPHFFYDFYVYQYATSIVASTAIANGIRDEAAAVAKSGKKNAPLPKRDAYLKMLSSGSSQYPIDLLKGAGVDMTTSAPFNAAIREMNLVMDEMEKLLK